MRGVVRAAVTSGLVMGGIFAVAVFGPALDRRGLPGGLFAMAVLLILVLVSLRVLLGEFPPRGRRRALVRAAKDRSLPFRTRPRTPRSMSALPSFSDQRIFGADLWHLISFPEPPVVMTFDRRVTPEGPYESPSWVASAACRIPFEAPGLIVEPRPAVTADPLGRLAVRSTESDRFGRRYRIRTEDELFATALLDQRMLGWMLEQAPDWTFEVGGSWAMVSHPDLSDPSILDASVEVLRTFCAKIPHVASSMRTSR